jgi:hypothetical protein
MWMCQFMLQLGVMMELAKVARAWMSMLTLQLGILLEPYVQDVSIAPGTYIDSASA